MNKPHTVNVLRNSAHEIRRLRQQIVEVKAEAWDVHSEVIKRLFSGPMGMSECAAHAAEQMARSMEEETPATLGSRE